MAILDDHRYHGYLIISLLKPLHAAAGLTLDNHRYHGYLIVSLLKPLCAAVGLGWQQGMITGTMVT